MRECSATGGSEQVRSWPTVGAPPAVSSGQWPAPLGLARPWKLIPHGWLLVPGWPLVGRAQAPRAIVEDIWYISTFSILYLDLPVDEALLSIPLTALTNPKA